MQGQTDSYKGEFLSPFEVVELNKANPYKNVATRDGILLGSKTEVQFRQDNRYYFSYSMGNLGTNMVAGFSQVERLMVLSPDFNIDDMVEAAVLYHELRHSAQDANLRGKIQSKEQYDSYMEFYKSKKLIINEEATAYAWEIEFLNLILDGELAENPTEALKNIKIIAKKLNASDKNLSTLSLILELAISYYPKSISKGDLSKTFFDTIAHKYQKSGYEVVVPLRDGSFRAY